MGYVQIFYELSPEADNDLSLIYDYTADKFGIDQAVKYLNGFDNIFQLLCSEPKLGRERNDIRKGLRSISYESHTSFYRILKDRIRVVRILHASRDITKFLPLDS